MLPYYSLCGAQGWVCWEEDNDALSGTCDHDVVECLVILRLPVLPRRAFHTYGWSSKTHLTHFGPNLHIATDYSFQAYPIRLSGSLIARSFLRRWLYVLTAGGLFAAFWGSRATQELTQFLLLTAGVGLLVFSLACAVRLRWTEARTRSIRRLLGRHRRGSSDPATWTDEDCAKIPEPQEVFGGRSYEDAVESLLEKGDYSGAMWAARLSVVKESRLSGEWLTTRVLHHTDVQRCLAAAEENPVAWLKDLRTRRLFNDTLIG